MTNKIQRWTMSALLEDAEPACDANLSDSGQWVLYSDHQKYVADIESESRAEMLEDQIYEKEGEK